MQNESGADKTNKPSQKIFDKIAFSIRFAEIYDELLPVARKAKRTAGADFTATERILADVYLKLLRAESYPDAGAAIKRLVYVVALRIARDLRRHAQYTVDVLDQNAAQWSAATQKLMFELNLTLEEIRKQVTDVEYEFWYDHDLEERTYEEIAKAAGSSVSTVQRAVEKVRRLIDI